MPPLPPPDPLDERFAALRAALSDATPPRTVDRAIDDAILAASRRRDRGALPRAGAARWLAAPLALAASIAMIAVVVRHGEPEPVAPAASLARQAPRFLPVVPIAEIERAGDAYVVPARVPRMALAEFGLPVHPAHAGEPVDTELLVRPNGTVLALRFLP